MAEFVGYGSIEQYRSVVHNTVQWYNHHKMPVGSMTFHGTVKLHGTNAAIGYDSATGEIWAQSRQNIITLENDNAGFAAFVERNKELITKLFYQIYSASTAIIIYGEWAGGNIQKGVALNGLEKFFTIFDIKFITPLEEPKFSSNALLQTAIPKDLLEQLNAVRIYNAEQFKTWDITVDFSFPEASVQQLIDITNEVEAECPVGKFFGVSGVGEGVVWTSNTHPDVRFKSKGEKHSDSKVKTIVAVDIEKVNSIREFCNSVLTDHRLDKIIETMKLLNKDITPVSTGDFIKMTIQDILKEENDVILASGLEWKELSSDLSRQARDWYLVKCAEF